MDRAMGKQSAINVPDMGLTAIPGAAAVLVRIAPIEGGWSVAASFNESPLVFKSGARAEQAGRQLAKAAAKSGLAVDLRIETRDGRLAEEVRYTSTYGSPSA